MNILSISNLTKSFNENCVIKDLSLDVPEHKIFGFIGANGAGKTTTMKMILGLLKPDSGTITVCGETVRFGETSTNRYVGYLPDVPEFYSYMLPSEYLRLCGEITGMKDSDIKARTEELLELVGLKGIGKRIGSFSRGMKQRLGIAQALFNKPKLLICDEPTSALDPVGRKEILDILLAVKSQTTVIFSTHILSDVEKVCDNIAVLDKGNIVISGTIHDLKTMHKKESMAVTFLHEEGRALFEQEFLKQKSTNANISAASETGLIIHAANIAQLQNDILKMIISLGISIQKIEVLEPTIESLFMEAVS